MTQIIETSLPYRYDRKVKSGSDLSWLLEFKENDAVTPKDTTGWELTLTISAGGNGEVYDTKTDADPEITHTPASGKFSITIPAAQVDAYDFSTAYYEISIYDGVSETSVFIIGDMRVT